MIKVLVMSGYGINCETETAHAFEKANATSDIVHVNDLISGKKKMSDYDIMVFPGGFSYGDDTGSGNAFAKRIKNNLWKDLKKFIESGKLILGICNGFQIMSNLGLFALPSADYGECINALLWNTNNRYECRWINLKKEDSACVFTKNIEISSLPIAHGEGRFYCDEKTLNELKKNKQIVFTYCNENGKKANGKFPANPNGSLSDIAAICDKTGRIMGMMPHPERAIYSFNTPDYHLKKALGEKMNDLIESNFIIFKNAVEFTRGEKNAR